MTNEELEAMLSDSPKETEAKSATKPVKSASESKEQKLTEELGPVNKDYILLDKNKDHISEFTNFTMGYKNQNGEKVTDPDSILAHFDIQEPFADEPLEQFVRVKNNDHDNKVIKLVFGKFGLNNFDDLKMLTQPGAVDKIKPVWHEKFGEDSFRFPIYKCNTTITNKDADGNDITNNVTFFKFTNRPGGESGIYGKTPNAYLSKETNMDKCIKGKIVAFRNNKRFHQFEIVFEPLTEDGEPLDKAGTKQYTDFAKANDIKYYTSMYKYGSKKNPGEIDNNKFTKQAGAIQSALNINYDDGMENVINQIVGQVRTFVIDDFKNNFKGTGRVYRAYLKK